MFVDNVKDKPNNYRQKNDTLKNTAKEEWFIGAFIHIILDAYKEYIKGKFPVFNDALKNKWTAESQIEIKMIDAIEEEFTITKNSTDRITVTKMNNFKKYHSDTFGTIPPTRFNEFMKEHYELEQQRTSAGRYWIGITEKK